MGRYHKVEGELKNDLPVWKMEGRPSYYIYYNINGQWVVDSDLLENRIHLWGPSNHAFLPLKAVPRFGWRVPTGKEWTVDETLVISAGEESNKLSIKGSHTAIQ